jgi:hypothetical protein
MVDLSDRSFNKLGAGWFSKEQSSRKYLGRWKMPSGKEYLHEKYPIKHYGACGG